MWCILIYTFSAESGYESANTSSHIVNILTSILNKLNSDNLTDNTINVITFIIRKMAHFTLYYILAILVYMYFLTYSISKRKNVCYTLIFCVIIAILDEIHQYFVPGRSAAIRDVLIDGVGSSIGYICIYYINKLISNRKNKKITNKV